MRRFSTLREGTLELGRRRKAIGPAWPDGSKDHLHQFWAEIAHVFARVAWCNPRGRRCLVPWVFPACDALVERDAQGVEVPVGLLFDR